MIAYLYAALLGIRPCLYYGGYVFGRMICRHHLL